MAKYDISLQLHTVRDEVDRDYMGTLRKVAKIGYPAVENGGSGTFSVEEMQALLAETGLRIDAAGFTLEPLEKNLEREIAYCKALNISYMLMIWTSPQERSDIPALAKRLNAIGKRLQEEGMTLAYHNHDFEFEQTDGVYFLDRLLAATDPAYLQLQLDVYWAAKGGADPLDFLHRYAGRVPLVHLKDMAPDRGFANIGEGIMDMDAIVTSAIAGGARWLIVENDEPRLPSLESARISLENLRAIIARIEAR